MSQEPIEQPYVRLQNDCAQYLTVLNTVSEYLKSSVDAKLGLDLVNELLSDVNQNYVDPATKEVEDITVLEKLEELVSKLPSSYSFTDDLEMLEFKVIITALKNLQEKMAEEKDIKEKIPEIQFLLDGMTTAIETIKFGQSLRSFEEGLAPYLVISVGSAGSDIEQQLPTFAKELVAKEPGKTPLVNVINIDPGFQKSGFSDKLSSKSIYVYNYAGAIGREDPNFYKNYLEINQKIENLIKKILDNPSKKCVLLDHVAPEISPLFCQFGTQYADKIGDRLEIIGSYEKDFPVVAYSKELFKDKSPEEINEIIRPVLDGWRNRYSFSEHRFQMDEAEFKRSQEPIKDYGKVQRNLQSLDEKDIFPKTEKTLKFSAAAKQKEKDTPDSTPGPSSQFKSKQ